MHRYNIHLHQFTIPVQKQKIEIEQPQKNEVWIAKEPVVLEPITLTTPASSFTRIKENEIVELPVAVLTSDIEDASLAIFLAETKTQVEYHFPVLTEEEKEANQKEKLRMAKAIVKSLRKVTYNIPFDRIEQEGKSISSDPFYMNPVEVTNLEYRTFLFDLLISGKKEAFLVAKPNQNLWNTEDSLSANGMGELYFSHPTYNLYPVNNISREGAEMYCKWLTKQVNSYLSKKGKPLINDIRIPSNSVWVFAARGGIKKASYPWGGPDARNAKGCYLANYNPEEAADADGSFYPVAVYSYSPNDYGLYCMSGNVAEMVYYNNDKTQPGTQSGGWNSSEKEIQLNGLDPYKGVTTPNVNIGFRWVISYGTISVDGKKSGK